MSRILVDTSVWIDYFADARRYPIIDRLIGENQICTNDLILAELIPFIQLQKQHDLTEALRALQKHEIRIDWDEITQFQYANLSHGINGVGIPDLIILENVMAHDLTLFAKDKHFRLMHKIFSFRLFDARRL
jgi:hypothetical protein